MFFVWLVVVVVFWGVGGHCDLLVINSCQMGDSFVVDIKFLLLFDFMQ